MSRAPNQVHAEAKAYSGLMEWINKALEVERAFVDAGLPLPPALRRFMGDTAEAEPEEVEDFVIPPLPWPPKPPGFEDGWVFVKTQDLKAASLILALLRASGGRLNAKELHRQAVQYDQGLALGGVYNVGKRLEMNGVISRDGEGWILNDPTRAPILFGDYAWGPPDLFAVHELASYRRFVLLHAIRSAKGGLAIMEAVNALGEFADFKLGHVTKDMVGVDFETMRKDGLVERVDNSRKWRARTEESTAGGGEQNGLD